MVPMPLLALLLSAVCPPQTLQAARFSPGEILNYKIDVLGLDVGTFEVRSQLPPPAEKRAVLELTSRAKTSAFVSTNAGNYEAFATALLAPDFAPLHYREDLDDGPVHRGVEVEFPPAQNGVLKVTATKNGEPEAVSLQAGPAVRDIISTLYLFRAQPMKEGSPVCVEVYAGRKIWRVQGQVAARETIDTPLGKVATMRVDAEAVRADDARVKRIAHVWVTDDERRLPIVAVGEMRGKVLRAQLVATNTPRKRAARR